MRTAFGVLTCITFSQGGGSEFRNWLARRRKKADPGAARGLREVLVWSGFHVVVFLKS